MTDPLPFQRRCGAQCGLVGVDGWLTVEAGQASFRFSAMRRLFGLPEVIVAAEPVTLYRARLLPPGLNSGLVLTGEQGAVAVWLWWGALRPVRAALAAGAVPVREVRSWVGIGWSRGLRGRRR